MLTSCGGGSSDAKAPSGPPSNASKTSFCGVFQDFMTETQDMNQGDTKAAVAALKKVGDKLQDVGTPSDIPADARAGFEKTLELIDSLKSDATEQDFANIDKQLTATEQQNSQAFDAYLTKECGDLAPSGG
jgi:hypothetical protein